MSKGTDSDHVQSETGRTGVRAQVDTEERAPAGDQAGAVSERIRKRLGTPWTSRKRGGSGRTSSLGTAIIFVLPAMVIIIVFHLYGAGRNIWLSLTDWTLAGADFVGLRNYIDLIQSGDFWNSLKVTVFFVSVVPITVAIAIPIAYILHFVVAKSYLYRLFLFLPFVVPTVATSLVWSLVVSPSPSGLVNAWLQPLGISRQSLILDSTGIFEGLGGWVGLTVPGWAAGPSIAMSLVVLVRFWQILGFTVLILYAGMTRIDPDLLDAARVDGATEPQILRKIVVPVLSPTILFVVVISLVFALREFNTIFVLTGGGPARTTETLAMLMYRQFWGDNLFAVGATTATVLFLIILVITWVQFRLSRRWVHYSGGQA